jgi:hypothetical protein
VPKLGNRLMAIYILAFPFIQALLALYVPVSLAMMLLIKLPIVATLVLLLPGYLLLAHALLGAVGLYEFTRAHGLRARWYAPLQLLVTYIPYQWALGYAALRAVWREVRGQTNWEKTAHVGAHRQQQPAQHVSSNIA